MAHNLFNKRYFGRKPAWHNLGEVMKPGENPDLVEAFTRGKLNYNFQVVDILAVADGNYVEFPDRKMVVRNPTDDDPVYRPIEIVSDHYSIVQNMEIAQMYNELSKKWPVETCGALGKGETIFATLDAGIVEIAGEEVKRFFLITDGKVGNLKTTIAYTPIQVVCQNTLNSGLAAADLKMDIKHFQGNKQKLQEIAEIAERLEDNAKFVNSLFGDMTKVKFSVDQFKELCEKVLFPAPEIPAKDSGIEVTDEFMEARNKILLQQKECVLVYQEYNDTRKGLAQNTFGAYSAVVDYVDFQPGRNSKTGGRYYSSLFGDRAKTKQTAFSNLLGYMKK